MYIVDYIDLSQNFNYYVFEEICNYFYTREAKKNS